MKTELTCIICPKGCTLTIQKENDNILISGNSCKKGYQYGLDEITNPKRTLTSTVSIKTDDIINRLAVISKSPVEKKNLIKICKQLKSVEIDHPVKQGDVVCNIEGIDFLASSTIRGDNEQQTFNTKH